jgi:hypothetical protein
MGGGVVVPPTPEYLQPRSLLDEWKDCVCGARVQKGLTVRGKPAWFQEIVDEDSGELVTINHWVTCTKHEELKAQFGERNDGTRQGSCPRCAGGAIVYTAGGATCSSCGWTSVPEEARRAYRKSRRRLSHRSRMSGAR